MVSVTMTLTGSSDSSDNEEAGVNHEIKEQVIDENLPPYLTEIPMDTLICPNIGNREGNGTLTELIASAVVSCDKANWEKTHEDSEKTDSDDSSSGVESVSSEESSIADNELNCKYAKYQTQKGHEGESAADSSADSLSGAKDQKGDFLCSSDDSFSGVKSILKDKSSSNGKSNDRKSVTSSYTTDDSLSGVESALSKEELISDEIETRSEKIPE